MKSINAPLMGFLLTPLVAAVITAFLSPVGRDESLIAWGLIPIFYFFAFLATGFLGAPAFFILRYFNLITWWATIIVGIVIGTVVGILLRLPNSQYLNDLIPPMFIGAISAFSFWAIWRYITYLSK